jgi:predicted DNA-binding transcriptional regulator YafY
MISPNFFAWVLGFGKNMRIIAPEAVKEEMLQRLRDMVEIYDEEV